MKNCIHEALDTMLSRWNTMSAASGDDAEEAANAFEASFYTFIDSMREWVYELEQQPATVDELLAHPVIDALIAKLPAPLYLNFETEAELILEHKHRVDEDKYD
ncbi:hypothetical protein [Paenibacillus hexagrammi]|uniref:Uncharacterized protein n=1 Tax=Paenibacillus hexagrammi TaxID=2908839 RepID=A0ABY3SFA5_9BACL|nr:hypothetical protein [Paenibacillus sp. YPD9-1]UJF32492.1 hypothetical protein L0M14_22880 [Paenibacillus sp. YPD9-1]